MGKTKGKMGRGQGCLEEDIVTAGEEQATEQLRTALQVFKYLLLKSDVSLSCSCNVTVCSSNKLIK